jgi:hypothetical protein
MTNPTGTTFHDGDPPPMRPLAIPIRTTRRIIGIGNTKLWELIGSGALETISIGRRRLVLVASIEQLIEKLRAIEADQPRSSRADSAISASVSARRARKATTSMPTSSPQRDPSRGVHDGK